MSNVLGCGHFGVVHLGTWTDGSAVAMKTLNLESSESDSTHAKLQKSLCTEYLRKYNACVDQVLLYVKCVLVGALTSGAVHLIGI